MAAGLLHCSLTSRSNLNMTVLSVAGSFPMPYSVLPERTSVSLGPCEVRKVTRLRRVTTWPAHVPASSADGARADTAGPDAGLAVGPAQPTTSETTVIAVGTATNVRCSMG